jgi:hypothetical protein
MPKNGKISSQGDYVTSTVSGEGFRAFVAKDFLSPEERAQEPAQEPGDDFLTMP